MNCDSVLSKLSAFIDLELSDDESAELEKHLETCSDCQKELRCFERLGEDLRNSEEPVDVEAMWGEIEARLDGVRLSRLAAIRGHWASLALAASLLLVLGGIAWLRFYPTNNDGHNHASLAVDFQPVIALASSDPVRALQGLVDKYQGQQLSAGDTAKYLGYQPSVSLGIPKGFKLVSTHVLNMPCCKCSVSVCQRANGKSLIVFEHKDEQPDWFGKNAGTVCQCGGVQCRIVEEAGELAVTWKSHDRQITMVGATDLDEVERWVRSLN